MKNLEQHVISPALILYRNIQIVIFLVALIVSYLFVYIKRKFKIDISGLLTLILILIATVVRVVVFFSFEEGGILNIIQLVLQAFVWYAIYYFVLEMLKVKHIIESQDEKENLSKAKRDRLYHLFLLIGFIIFIVGFGFIRYIKFYGDAVFYINNI